MKAMRTWLAGLILASVAGLAQAADLGDPIPGRPGLTYFDLMKLVITDLAPAKDGATGHAIVPFQHIEGKDAAADPADTITLTSVEVMPIPGGASRIVVLADLGPSEGNVADAELLALFTVAPTPRLLDVVEVGSDRVVGFRRDKPIMLAADAPLILIDSEHDNSDQSYVSTAMVFIRHDRFRLINTVFTFGQASCADRLTQTPSFAALADPGPYRAVFVRVREEVTATGDDCGDDRPMRPHVKLFQATYRWDARRGRFVTRSTELDRLAKEDEKRF